ncbi:MULTISPECIES: hypothetical protein [unclassified Meiothermus]|uniref:hypothetical protein n=1 Tax=unclassified Meiothermus TaxID=370471 RepID=UPI000D7C3C8F|nr:MULTISPECIES: hypothetical protein [unclassified Meiothermus]PZA06500.1 hypothetical protein DNA98_13010 [Meiothermus sp. Pnk-1]RYM37173.1 hypothetical protein EWH23_06770 [Meiothermus sp. PNK-Is4]
MIEMQKAETAGTLITVACDHQFHLFRLSLEPEAFRACKCPELALRAGDAYLRRALDPRQSILSSISLMLGELLEAVPENNSKEFWVAPYRSKIGLALYDLVDGEGNPPVQRGWAGLILPQEGRQLLGEGAYAVYQGGVALIDILISLGRAILIGIITEGLRRAGKLEGLGGLDFEKIRLESIQNAAVAMVLGYHEDALTILRLGDLEVS